MQKQKGFTLVELLVVITIIGILATGAISMFTGAQQKARDSVRITDIQAVKLALEQYYGDKAEYPQAEAQVAPTAAQHNANLTTFKSTTTGIGSYIDKIPKDPKSGEFSTQTAMDYAYGAKDDTTTGVQAQEFELSTGFENDGNISSKAADAYDKGSCSTGLGSNTNNCSSHVRLEIGINVDQVNSDLACTTTNGCSVAKTLKGNTYKTTANLAALALN